MKKRISSGFKGGVMYQIPESHSSAQLSSCSCYIYYENIFSLHSLALNNSSNFSPGCQAQFHSSICLSKPGHANNILLICEFTAFFEVDSLF